MKLGMMLQASLAEELNFQLFLKPSTPFILYTLLFMM